MRPGTRTGAVERVGGRTQDVRRKVGDVMLGIMMMSVVLDGMKRTQGMPGSIRLMMIPDTENHIHIEIDICKSERRDRVVLIF